MATLDKRTTIKRLDEIEKALGSAQEFTPATWGTLEGKPSTFPPADHSHEWEDVTGKPSTFPPADHSHEWEDVTGKPAVFPAEPHDHTEYATQAEVDALVTRIEALETPEA